VGISGKPIALLIRAVPLFCVSLLYLERTRGPRTRRGNVQATHICTQVHTQGTFETILANADMRMRGVDIRYIYLSICPPPPHTHTHTHTCMGQLTADVVPQHSRLVSESVSHRLETIRNSHSTHARPRESSSTSRALETSSNTLKASVNGGSGGALEDEVFALKREKARLESELQRNKEREVEKRHDGESATIAAAQAAATAAKSSSAAVAAADAVHVRDLEDQVLQLKRDLLRESARLESEQRGKQELEEKLREASIAAAVGKQAYDMILPQIEQLQADLNAAVAEKQAYDMNLTQIEQLQADLRSTQEELAKCKKGLAVQERSRRASPDSEAAKEMQQLKDAIRQAERDAETAQAKAAEELAAIRAATVRELSRVKADVEALNVKLREKGKDLELAQTELQRARMALADMLVQNQELEEEVSNLRKAHRPCAAVIEELSKKITNLQVTGV